MTKKAIMCAMALLLLAGAARAANDPAQNQVIPPKDGVYDVTGHPELLVRVFVHKANPNFAKKTNPIEACVDPNSTAVVKSAGWKLPSGDWKYYVNSASANPYTSSFKDIAANSFTAWKSGTDLPTNFVNAGDTTKTAYSYDNQNILTWGAAPSNALAVTYTWYERKTKMALENDTIMNKNFPWSSSECGETGIYDVQDILTHELGHWVGLNDHYTSAYKNNTMYGYGSTAETKKNTLTTGDIAGVNNKY